MKFSQMLMTPVTPLSEVEPPKTKAKRSGNPAPDSVKGHRARNARATAAYKLAMGKNWMKTKDIERNLGYAPGCVWEWLDLRFKEGLVDRRPAGGGTFNRRFGWEWKWK